MREFAWFAVIAGAVILEALTAPGSSRSGLSWELSRSGSPGMVHFTMERSRPGQREVDSTDMPLSRFRGFSLEMLDRSGPAKFTFEQDAGTLQCEGRYAWGRGSGSFTLTPNAAYVSELNRLGFSSPQGDEVYLLMIANVTLDFVREVHTAGIASSLRDLLDMAAHGVNQAYVRDLARAGYRDLRAPDYVELHDHGVDAKFVDELKQAGYDIPANRIVELHDHGVDSNFVRELQLSGLRPSPAELVELHDHGVTPGYLRGLHDAGFDTLPAGKIIELRDHGVATEFVMEASDLGYRFTPGEMVELHDHGVDVKYLRTIHDSGMKNLTAAQIVQLRDHGVE
jgi:hypothetical protein